MYKIMHERFSSSARSIASRRHLMLSLRSDRQGCPIAPYLSLLCAEILAISIWRSDEIKGLKFNFMRSSIFPFVGKVTHKTLILSKVIFISGEKLWV
jgi:hypothetical protein